MQKSYILNITQIEKKNIIQRKYYFWKRKFCKTYYFWKRKFIKSIIFGKESFINEKKVLNFIQSLISEKKVIKSKIAFCKD